MFDWYHYLNFADDLVKGDLSKQTIRECMLRNAVSRAYYAAYCCVRNLMRRKQVFFPTGKAEDHGDLINLCKTHPNFDVKAIGKDLDWLRDRRNSCDYDDDLDHLLTKDIEGTALQALDRAFGLLDEIVPQLENEKL